MKVVVVGGGVAGLVASIALAREGNEVVLLDRDDLADDGVRSTSPFEARPGCPQRNQGHALLARARALLEANTPGVVEALIAAGANVTDGNLVLPPEHHDDALRSIAVRRNLIDEVLLSTLRDNSGVTFEAGTVGALVDGGAPDGVPLVTGVQTTDGRTIAADLVVDASGRRSPFPSMVAAISAQPPAERTGPCGLVYYSRYFEIVAGAPRPPMFVPVAIRGSLGYMGFAVFWQDANIINVGLAPETADRDLHAVRSEAAFMAAARSIRMLAGFVDESFATPVSDIHAMGSLQNTRRSYVAGGKPVARGFVAIGDSLSHTDPTFAYGMSMAIEQAFRLPALVRSHGVDAAVGLEEAVGAELDERYEHVSKANAERMEIAAGRRADLDADDECVLELGALLLARSDPSVLRRYFRRVLAVDLPSAMTGDQEFMAAARAAIVEAGLLDRKPVPAREELLRVMSEAEAAAEAVTPAAAPA